ncbi:nucleotide exchange factor GrpE [Plastoroseomonas hellenica]|uniref:Protein GrpE n=1 Tax=Plastoroseomonas hellenica TaxID=2687306 RepID=A0ABS5F4L7_9PROT|nr:nucleotide exchange factor GrpE [Plastoroseomonas hellenica]MBR0646542.1 nucleotide exchange factor GrpE [Plastoroseomonas hellenica]MBR0667505.1 nucleotide exchange factor GrpE [Plastoroseomonas hellenica]
MTEQNEIKPAAETPAPESTETAATPETRPEPTAEESIAALEAEVALMRDKWLRAEAEMQNLRARTQREVADARNFAIQRFAKDVVEAADNLARGLAAIPAAAEQEPELFGKLRGGFEGVERAFLGILERHGIQRQDATGKPFDPELHQAMAEQPAPEGVAPGTVIQAWTPAWTLNGRLLKPAMVVVAGKAE